MSVSVAELARLHKAVRDAKDAFENAPINQGNVFALWIVLIEAQAAERAYREQAK